MRTFESFSANHAELTQRELSTVKGGSTYTRRYADGRTVVYGDGGSITFYDDGRVYAIAYGESAGFVG